MESKRGTRALVTVVCLGFVLMAQPASASTTPQGYQRVVVDRAAISIAIPTSWQVCHCTRADLEQQLADNPQWVAQGITVDDLLQTFRASWDGDGDGYDDRELQLRAYPEGRKLVSLADLRDWVQQNKGSFRDPAVKRTQVRGKPAFVVTYGASVNRSDGSPTSYLAEDYFFMSSELVRMTFKRFQEDPGFDKITRTILNSIVRVH